MKNNFLKALIAAALLGGSAAHADVLYTFTAQNVHVDFSGEPMRDFNFTLQFSDYVSAIGFAPVAPVQSDLTTALGYEVAYAGLWSANQWAFDDLHHGAVIGDAQIDYDPTSFTFGLYNGPATAPGVYQGSYRGNARDRGFLATGALTISETSAVPEPSAVALLGLGVAGLALARRRRA